MSPLLSRPIASVGLRLELPARPLYAQSLEIFQMDIFRLRAGHPVRKGEALPFFARLPILRESLHNGNEAGNTRVWRVGEALDAMTAPEPDRDLQANHDFIQEHPARFRHRSR